MRTPGKVFAFICLSLLTVQSGCKTAGNAPSAAELDALAADPTASNYFVGFYDPGEGDSFLAGVRRDYDAMPEWFGTTGLGFQVRKSYDMSPSEVKSSTATYASLVGANGTLIWAFSGHGHRTGELHIGGSGYSFETIANAIKGARSTPLKRLVVLVDACFSGNLINGYNKVTDFNLTGEEQPLPTEEELSAKVREEIIKAFGEHGQDPDAEGFGLAASSMYEQLIVIVSSSRYETSGDNGTYGGRLQEATWRTIKDMQAEKAQNNFTINDFLTKTMARVAHIQKVEGRPGRQTPSYAVYPSSVKYEPFFATRGYTPPTNTGGGGGGTANSGPAFKVGVTFAAVNFAGSARLQINTMSSGSRAEQAGLSKADMIKTVYGREVTNLNEWDAAINAATAARATSIPVTFYRGYSLMQVNIATGAGAVGVNDYVPTPTANTGNTTYAIGVSFTTQANNGSNWLVAKTVSASGKAYAARLRDGDFIETVNGTRVSTVAQYDAVIQAMAAAGGRTLTFTFYRNSVRYSAVINF